VADNQHEEMAFAYSVDPEIQGVRLLEHESLE
jgi:hypothetical protein